MTADAAPGAPLAQLDYRAPLAQLDSTGLRLVIDQWAEQTSAFGARPDAGYVLITDEGGASGEAYGYADVPPVPAAELQASPCRFCAEDPGDRLIAEALGWRAWAAAGSPWPYAVVLAPMSHRPDLPALGDWERDALADLLADVLRRFDPMPYWMWVHQRPSDGRGWPNAHVHVEISGRPAAPSAAQLGTGVHANPVSALETAERLRATGATPP